MVPAARSLCGASFALSFALTLVDARPEEPPATAAVRQVAPELDNRPSDVNRADFEEQFLRLSDLAAEELSKEITPFNDRNNADPATHHMPFFEDAHAVRALAVAYDMCGKEAYLDACRHWADRIIAHQRKMIPAGAYYMNHSRAPGQDEGQWNVADSGSIGMGVLATAVRCADAAQRARYLESVKAFVRLVMENYVGPGGGITNGLWPKYSGEWWCSTATFGTLAFLLYEETGEERYLEVAQDAFQWMLRQDFRQLRPITFEQRPSGIIFYCFELYAAGLKYVERGTSRHERAVEQIGRALDWMAANQKSRGADVPDYLERNVDMAALPYLMYAFARQVPRFRDQIGAADGELRYVGDLLLGRGEPNVSRLMVWEVMTWGMLSFAERLVPGALCRGPRRSEPRSASAVPPEDASEESAALHIGDRRQVFIDGLFLEKARGLELHVHEPQKTGEFTIRPDRPWERGGIGPYSTVLKDGSTYRMWYHAMDTVNWDNTTREGCICYASSTDGIHWEKPELGLTEYKGNRKNNIVLGHGAGGVHIGQAGAMVFVDPTAAAAERYRMVKKVGEIGEGIHVFSSADGLLWTLTHRKVLSERPQKRGHHLDSQNVIFWDDRIKKYVTYGRRNLRRDGSQGRSIFRGESANLTSFPVAQDMPVVLSPDPSDLFHGSTAVVDYYTNAAIKYRWADDAYYMFPTAYYHYTHRHLREFKDGVPTNAGPLHTQFAASRDGIAWQRFDRRPFVRLGMRGTFDWASCRVIHGVVPDTTGRRMFLYYWASDRLHGWDRDDRNKRLLRDAGFGATQDIAVLSRLVVRRDGFISVRAEYTGGEFTTPPLVFRGAELVLNVDTSATGLVRVGILDSSGRAVSGFGLEQCDRIHTTNETDRIVTWEGARDVSRLAGTPVRLRFEVRDADLYAFQFRP